jgi:hypothetical protein
VRNSFWYAYHRTGSRATVVEADAYKLPDALGEFDIGVLAAILEHCRNPFDMLQSVAARCRQGVVVTETYSPLCKEGPVCAFLPNAGLPNIDTWWHFAPQFFVSTLGVLGFTKATVNFHEAQQPGGKSPYPMYTVTCFKP